MKKNLKNFTQDVKNIDKIDLKKEIKINISYKFFLLFICLVYFFVILGFLLISFIYFRIK